MCACVRVLVRECICVWCGVHLCCDVLGGQYVLAAAAAAAASTAAADPFAADPFALAPPISMELMAMLSPWLAEPPRCGVSGVQRHFPLARPFPDAANRHHPVQLTEAFGTA